MLLLQKRATWLLSVAMGLEYESICLLAEHRLAAPASAAEAANLLSSIFEVVEPVEVHDQWRPQLKDATDEMVLECAVNGRADAILTFNLGDESTSAEPFWDSAVETRRSLEGGKKMSRVSTFPLRLPNSLKAAVERMAEADGTSVNQFLVMAAAEKLSAIQTAESFFAARRGQGDLEGAVAFLSRSGGEAPRSGDAVD